MPVALSPAVSSINGCVAASYVKVGNSVWWMLDLPQHCNKPTVL